jgi:hypothetical protein
MEQFISGFFLLNNYVRRFTSHNVARASLAFVDPHASSLGFLGRQDLAAMTQILFL